jgi:putative membrane protein
MQSQSPTVEYERPLLEIRALKSLSLGATVVLALALSAAVFGFLAWLVYVKPATPHTSGIVPMLPAVNAVFNSVSAAFLVAGFFAIKRGDRARHTNYMLGALASSGLFFVGYVIYHHFHGETKFTGTGWIRPVYFFVLISHIVLSAVSVPLILLSFLTSLAGRLQVHKMISRYTFPIWLYVSVTGVAVFVMLKTMSPR